MVRMKSDEMDRAAGVLLGQACGDALGVPYEFGPPLDAAFQPRMIGGGPFGFAPGEYSDDTAMAVCIAQVAATGTDLTSDDALDEIAANFIAWAEGSRDVGNQTRAVLSAARRLGGRPGESAQHAATAHIALNPNAAGNGALMRTAVIALSRPHDRDATASAANKIASLTHAGPLSVDSCVLWTEAVRVAVTENRLDLLGGLDLIDAKRRRRWQTWIDESTDVDPRTFGRNGYTVSALQAAWAAITWTSVPETEPMEGRYAAQHFELALMNAVRAGDDADTVGAIAGGLLAAYWGRSAIPNHWQRAIYGYGNCRAHELVSLAALTASQGGRDCQGWPTTRRMAYEALTGPIRVVHPHDEGVVLGSYGTLDGHGCDAVVSLCRVGAGDRIDSGNLGADHVEIRLLDSELTEDNPHLDFVLKDAARAIATLRAEEKSVFVHCVRGEQRTPAVAVAYARLLGVENVQAQNDVLSVLPSASGRGLLWNAASQGTVCSGGVSGPL
jgi:ADP-ribosyl-[dinitrogen reductase] hydrolase